MDMLRAEDMIVQYTTLFLLNTIEKYFDFKG